MRIMLNGVLQAVAQGQTMAPDQYADILNVVRRDKRRVAREVMSQHTAPEGTG